MPTKATSDKSKTAETKKSSNKYFYAIGRRKSSSATVRLYPNGQGNIVINEKNLKDYFPSELQQINVLAPLNLTSLLGKFNVEIKVKGGGFTGQSDAIKLGIARALILWNKDLRSVVKAEGLLSRDARIKERKKPGLKRARRAPQWQKR